ncbi:DUF927 domain-containing protein [Volucribacter amazonae]|uniref:DNA primase n=1 Tax=Volucribacter amazonae TaxID=256731 RepID=A0A9X4PA21_9PAST|nr:DUF927 domain-containing protein [Volucribacter amazonae]MDG6894392.1 DNA primase [Volucribacter amazonae]
MANKLTNAPNLSEVAKRNEPLTELYILVGANAWAFYRQNAKDKATNGQGLDWQIFLDSVDGQNPNRYDSLPIVLGQHQINQLEGVKIAPKGYQIATLVYTEPNPLTQSQIATLCVNLAQNSDIQRLAIVNNIGERLEDLTDYLARIRQGDSVAEVVAKNAIEPTKTQNRDNLLPYIEKRTEGGKSGLYRIIPKHDRETGEITEQIKWLSDVVEVIGIGRSESESYIVMQWQLEGSQDKVIEALPLGDIGEREGWRTLKNRGLKVTTNTALKNELADYLQNAGDRSLWTITNATGWQNGAYLLPNGEVVGEPSTPVLFRSQSAGFQGYHIKGTVESWQQEIAQYIKGNSSMMLGVAVALSAPLIHFLDAESFGVHLFGGSTSGKTTTANIASSLYGHPEMTRVSWNATALGLTNEAAARNDGFLVMDEIGQGINKKYIEQTAYALFNGIGKVQGAKEGGNRELQRWRIMAFSTGEIDLEGYLSQAGIKTNAGQLVRLLNVPITPATQFYQFNEGKAHADHLNQASKSHYGAVGRAWIKWIIEHKDDIATAYQGIKEKWLARLPQGASSQVMRVAGRFAVLETALQLAQHLTQWTETENAEALLHCFNEWINVFGLHSREEKQVIDQVNGWLLANAESRFISYPFQDERAIHNIAGYRMLITGDNKKEHYYVYPLAFEEVIKGNPKEQACRILSDKGMLMKGKENGYKYMVKLPHRIDSKRTRCYMLFPIIEDEEE